MDVTETSVPNFQSVTVTCATKGCPSELVFTSASYDDVVDGLMHAGWLPQMPSSIEEPNPIYCPACRQAN